MIAKNTMSTARARGIMPRLAPFLLASLVAIGGCSNTEQEQGGLTQREEQGGLASAATIQVYKTPTCGCCEDWIEHLENAGFDVEATNMPDLDAFKASNGVSPKLASCHTAMVDGYVIEGHVPASDIKRLLAERPGIAGLAVPGMPMGSPGMEHPDPRRHEAYDVLAFGGENAAQPRIFASHTP